MSFLFIGAVLLLMLAGLFFFSSNDRIRTEAAEPAEVQGSFTLLLYGSSSPNDPSNVAILDKEGDAYSFEIYAPSFSFTTRTGLTADQALQEAERFVRRNIRSDRSRLRKVLSPAGAVIGFELRPLFSVAAFGREDILNVRYSIRDRTIVVRVEADHGIERPSTD